jgi:ABC-type transport system involved in multi-copper enzyme maturation permease subunit
MHKILTLIRYELSSIAKSRWFWVLTAVYNALYFFDLYFSNDSEQLFVSLLNLIVYLNACVLLFFSTLYWQSHSEFISLLLTQTVTRFEVFISRVVSFGIMIMGSTSVFLLVHLWGNVEILQLLSLLGTQAMIQGVFCSIGFWIAIRVHDRLKAMAGVFVLLVLFVFLLDALILGVIVGFQKYPLEYPVLLLSMLNPIALTKLRAISEVNASLWSGYAGVLLTRAYRSGLIQGFSQVVLVFWLVLPLVTAWRQFKKRDF